MLYHKQNADSFGINPVIGVGSDLDEVDDYPTVVSCIENIKIAQECMY